MLHIDGLIFELQETGGISRVWASIIQQLIKKEINFKITENSTHALKNVYREKLEIPNDKIIQTCIPARIRKYLSSAPSNSVTFPSYYQHNVNSRTVQICHDLMPEQLSSTIRSRAATIGRSIIYEKAQRIICVSEWTLKEFRRIYERQAQKALVIPNPVNFDQIDAALNAEQSTPQNTPIENGSANGVYIGFREGEKNFWEIEKLLSPGANIKLVVIGPPPTDSELSRLRALGIADRVSFTGKIPDSQLYSIVRNSDFLFFPSKNEGFGLPIVEAIYLGTPVIGRRTDINTETSLDCMLYYDPEYPASIQNTAIEARSLKRAHNPIIKSWKQKISKYDSASIANQYLEVYLSVRQDNFDL